MAVRVVDVTEEVEVGHDQRQRPLEALRPAELLGKRSCEVPRVEEAGFRIDARLRLQLRDAEGAVDENKRGDCERDQPRVRLPERKRRDAEGRKDEICREVLCIEEPRLAQREAAGEVQ